MAQKKKKSSRKRLIVASVCTNDTDHCWSEKVDVGYIKAVKTIPKPSNEVTSNLREGRGKNQ